MMRIKTKAFILGTNYNALSISQELYRHKIQSVCMDSNRNVCGYSFFSQYVKIANPLVDLSLFRQQFLSLLKEEDAQPVIIPTDDVWAIALAEIKDQLPDPTKACVANRDRLSLILDKDKFYEKANQLSIDCPVTYSAAQARENLITDFPIIAKPILRANPLWNQDAANLAKRMNAHRLTILSSADELSEFLYQQAAFLKYFIFQKFVPGDSSQMYTIGAYIDQENKILALFSGHKVRGYPADSGDCIVGESWIGSNELVNKCKTVTQSFGLTGIAEFEFKRDLSTGKFYLIEVNPRAWSWIGITPRCGVNLPLMAYSDLSKEIPLGRVSTQQNSQEIRYMKIFQDFQNVCLRYRLDHPQWAMNPLTWLRSISWRKTVFAEFNRFDPLVILRAVVVNLFSTLKFLATRS